MRSEAPQGFLPSPCRRRQPKEKIPGKAREDKVQMFIFDFASMRGATEGAKHLRRAFPVALGTFGRVPNKVYEKEAQRKRRYSTAAAIHVTGSQSRSKHTNVHQRAKQILLPLSFSRYLKITVPRLLGKELFD